MNIVKTIKVRIVASENAVYEIDKHGYLTKIGTITNPQENTLRSQRYLAIEGTNEYHYIKIGKGIYWVQRSTGILVFDGNASFYRD
jgi:hypothetical protein